VYLNLDGLFHYLINWNLVSLHVRYGMFALPCSKA
jgi:hypothetical protein